jgi:hypothetical protein
MPYFLDFNQKWMDAVLPHLVDGGILGSFIDWRGLPITHAATDGAVCSTRVQNAAIFT